MKKALLIILLIFVMVMDSCTNTNGYNVSRYLISYNGKYDNKELLDLFANILNHSVPSFKKINHEGFFVDEVGRTIGFFVFDLTDPTNTIPPPIGTNKIFQFIDGHVYDFCPLEIDLSISHIAYLEKSNIMVFKGINCPEKGDEISIVLGYLDEKLKNDFQKKEILERVKRYRDYGYYVKIDTDKVYCTEFVK